MFRKYFLEELKVEFIWLKFIFKGGERYFRERE